ncbi:MAG: hypothetical protein ACOYJ0_06400, partial [Eubacterium sp.]
FLAADFFFAAEAADLRLLVVFFAAAVEAADVCVVFVLLAAADLRVLAWVVSFDIVISPMQFYFLHNYAEYRFSFRRTKVRGNEL